MHAIHCRSGARNCNHRRGQAVWVARDDGYPLWASTGSALCRRDAPTDGAKGTHAKWLRFGPSSEVFVVALNPVIQLSSVEPRGLPRNRHFSDCEVLVILSDRAPDYLCRAERCTEITHWCTRRSSIISWQGIHPCVYHKRSSCAGEMLNGCQVTNFCYLWTGFRVGLWVRYRCSRVLSAYGFSLQGLEPGMVVVRSRNASSPAKWRGSGCMANRIRNWMRCSAKALQSNIPASPGSNSP